ncbi:DUF3263 domain-containing protein [Euzebya sp.]|uniref:DUF3263 domain-containing protein n=1 Tax=Euzebya sp. TaxID=1971409 RepID=UPI00351682D5
MPRRELSDRDRAVLDFERDWTAHQGGKLAAIAATFGFSPTRYYQVLAELVDSPAAERHDPLLVRRLRRRRRARHARTTAPGLTDHRGRGQTK